MAKLDLDKAIEYGCAVMEDRYSLTCQNIRELATRPILDAVCDSFAIGYYQGMKAARAEVKRKGGVSKCLKKKSGKM